MQAQERPRFRHDLVAELVEEGGQRFIDVGDPDSGNTFRFYEVEYSLACAMDGERDVAGIVKWAQEELGLTPSPTEVQTVISTLADLRFIDSGAATHVDRRPAAAAAAATAGAVASAVASSPAAAPAKADGLAQGVVVAKSQPTAAPKTGDVELGSAGSKSAPVADKLPAAPELELGAPGAAAAATPPKAPVEDIALGSPGASPGPAPAKKAPASEVSIDLSAHMEVKPDDVKDAVRQSKVMTAVEVPKELLEAESPKAAPAAAAAAISASGSPAKAEPAKAEKAAPKAEPVKAEKPAEKAPDKVAASSAGADKAQAKADKAQDKADKAQTKADKAQAKADDKKADDKAAAKAEDKKADEKKAEDKKADAKKTDDKTKKDDKAAAAKPAVESPSKRPATDKPVAPPAPRARVSPVLVFTLILAVVGAGAFFVYKYVLNKPEQAAPQTKTEPVQPTPPPPPPEAKASVSAETPPAQEIKAPAAGTIETIEANGKDVKTGDVIATLAGGAPMQREIATLTKAVERTQAPVDAAQKALEAAQAKENNEQGVTAAQTKLDTAKKAQADAQAKLDAKKAELDKLSIKATSDGKLTGAAKAKDAVTADQVIASIERPAMHVATFTLPADAKLPADGKLETVAGGNPVDCTVIDQQVSTIKVQCPVDAVPAGTELTLKLTR